MRLVTDRTTGLALGRPQNWHQLKPSAFDLVMVHDDPSRPENVFQPNVVATVVPVGDAATVAAFTKSSTSAWLRSVPTGHVVAIDYYSADSLEARRVISYYDEQGVGVTMASFCFVHAALATRVDISFGVWNTADGLRESDHIMQSFEAPKAFAEGVRRSVGTGNR